MGKQFRQMENMKFQEFLRSGERLGFQRACDMIQCALHDPEIMQGNAFGRERILRVMNGAIAYDKKLGIAFTHDPEADVAQRDLDAIIADIYQDDIQTFYERYPDLRQINYAKPRKEWR